MYTIQRKLLTQEYNRCLAFIETSIKIIGPSFSLDKSFSEFRQLQTGEKFSPEAVVSLDKAMERAKEVFSLMEQDINEVVETLKSKWITKLN
jgi:HD-GYP domain-containing protein (c-di-GMP phosphodiesterase class II)